MAGGSALATEESLAGTGSVGQGKASSSFSQKQPLSLWPATKTLPCKPSTAAPVEPSLSCGEMFVLPMAQPRGKSDLCEQQDVGEGRQWGTRLSPIIPPRVDANPAWLLLESAHCCGNRLGLKQNKQSPEQRSGGTKKAKKAPASPAKEEKPKLTIFEEEVDPNEGLFGPEKDFSAIGLRRKMKENLKLFEDPDLGGVVRLGDSLLLPAACEHSKDVLSRDPEEDTEELLRVEDDFEKLLEVTSKPKPKVPPKPQKPAVAPRSTNSPSLAKQKENRIQTMNEVDILQYIQENESINNQDTSLF
ncbi:HCLS1-binding protein 3-like [Cyanistes caeruleus]|uniref:HCLS1-binding protein 3-like n=1 Tax=Cyanistes caeruleus TaxID=156563 RepID=UPI000CDA7D81|nr:HCLS1-binding protein 3-like [Cyanistes caeruleus]